MRPVLLLLGVFLLFLPLAAQSGPADGPLAANASTAPDDVTIFCVYPPDARIGDRVIIFGTNFDTGAIALFGSTPSVPTFIYSTPDPVPTYGHLSIMVALVPPAIFAGSTPIRVQFQGETSNPEPFRTRLFGGSYNQGPDPELWCTEPEQGRFLRPVALIGFDFTDESVPFFGAIPSLNLGTVTFPNIPLFGRFSAMLTFVPSFFPGTVDVTVRRNGDVTESVPFQVRRLRVEQ